jgi:hypothetical protein
MLEFVTTLTNSFSEPFLVLLKSIRQRGGVDYKFTVVEYDEISHETKVKALDYCPVEWVRREDLGELHRPVSAKERMVPNFQKPTIWMLRGPQTRIYIDVDIVCVDDLSGMQDWKPITAVREWFPVENNPQHYNQSPIPIWNCGVFAFKADPELYFELREFYKTYDHVDFGEQRITNDYVNDNYPESVHYADYGYNWRYYLGGCSASPRLIHSAHDNKPWKDEPANAGQRMTFDLYRGVRDDVDGVYDRFSRSRQAVSAGWKIRQVAGNKHAGEKTAEVRTTKTQESEEEQ